MSTTIGTTFGRHPHQDALELLKTTCTSRQQLIATKEGLPYKASLDHEAQVRQKLSNNLLYLVVVNGISSWLVFFIYLVSIESLISVALSVGFTVYAHNEVQDRLDFDGSIMSWTLLSFAIITPTSSAISMAFRRREESLVHLASLRATLVELYTAHSIWDWNLKPGDSVNTGRSKSDVDWREHSDSVLGEMFGICVDITRFLSLPDSDRGRHRFFPNGQRDATSIHEVQAEIQQSITLRFGRLASFSEILKREGLPGNESNRVRQWEQFCLDYFQKLRMIKTYRTPQALRTFSRLFSAFLPPFYAPYYAQMGKDLNSLGIAITFSVLTSLALTSLFETVYHMEDPFSDICKLDGSKVPKQLLEDLSIEMLLLRQSFFPDAKVFTSFPDAEAVSRSSYQIMHGTPNSNE